MNQQRVRDGGETRQAPRPLPRQLTTFVGREEELADIERLLANDACRLLTLVGVGGVGKTRLAIEAARQARTQFSEGAAYVPLQNVRSATNLAPAIVDALRLSRRDTRDPWQQLLDHLHEREMLLILDNFEQLRDAASRLTALLQAASGVKLLVTSREALRLEEEWRYTARGLTTPDSADASDWKEYDALQLLVDRARRVRPDFNLQNELKDAIRLCQLLEGMPLAIEMAASWLRSANCQQIASEVEQNLDLLHTTMSNVASRHRSLRAVFRQSWQRLTDEEREVYARLAAFHGPFRWRMARDVALASLPVLSSLVDRSLLRWEPDGRYQTHTLLRQYAAEQLERDTEVAQEIRTRHSRAYAAFLHERRAALRHGSQREALDEIEAELENVRAAWQWAVAQRDVDVLLQSTEALAVFYDFRGRYLEGLRALEAAAAALEEGESTSHSQTTRAMLLANLAALLIRVGRLEKAEVALGSCEGIFERHGRPETIPYTGDPLFIRGIIALIRGDYQAAQRLGRQAQEIGEMQEQPLNLQAAHYLLGRAALLQGRAQNAGVHFQKAYELGQREGDRWFTSYSLNELGNLTRLQGRYARAADYFEKSYAIRKTFEDPEGMAVALNGLGDVALRREDTTGARHYFRRALRISEGIGNQGGVAEAQGGLGAVALAEGDTSAAQRHLKRALGITRQFHFVPLLLSLFVSAGKMLAQRGEEEQGLALLTAAWRDPRSEHETRERARQALEQLGGPAQTELEPKRKTAWDELAQLARTLEAMPAGHWDADERRAPQSSPELVERLTEREAEVLLLLADGLTNAQIAERLVLAIGTVKYYTSEIYGKLEVNNRTQAVNRARELDLL